MMSCTGTYVITDDQTRYYDDYFNSYHYYDRYTPYPFHYYQYRNFYNYQRNYFYVLPQQNRPQINQQRGARPNRTVVPMTAPRRNTPTRQITPSTNRRGNN